MYCSLPKFEIWIYFVFWITGVFYSMYHVYLAGKYFEHLASGTIPSWSFINRRKDVADTEWVVWAPYIYGSLPWLCIHLVVAEIVRYTSKELLPLWYLAVSVMFLLRMVGLVPTVFMLLEPCVMYLLLQFRNKALLYIAGFILIAFHNLDSRMDWMLLSPGEQYMLTICSAWIYMRSQSFCLDQISSKDRSASLYELIMMLGYCLYFPMLFLGPLVLFEKFEAGMSRPYIAWTKQRFKTLVINLLRYFWWMLFMEIFLHFIYATALQHNIMLVRTLGAWAHYGLGYSMGMIFQLKYVIVYGLSCTIARAEQIEAPSHPKCIGRIHLYSDMWRHFDQGLYFFLRKYIYIPVLNGNTKLSRRLLASLACFSFICIWHRVYLFVLIWSTLNYIGVTVESVCKAIGSTPTYKYYETVLLNSPQNVRRFHALIATPLFMMSALSNFYFFAGMHIGNHFMWRLFNGSFQHNTCLFLLCYCCSQVSIEVKNWELRKEKKQI